MSAAPVVMVVEDDDDIRDFVVTALVHEGYRVVEVPHGEAALESIDECHPDLILLDMRMPYMDGWEFARRYREDHPSPVPIIVMTAAPDAQERQRDVEGIAALAKPFSLDELFAVVERSRQA